jgi:hypothetical protein
LTSFGRPYDFARYTLRAVLILALALVGLIGSPTQHAAAAIGGPVILGGDDMTDHGCVDGSGNPIRGWLYIQKALENIKPNVTRTNDNSVAAIGSAATTTVQCGNAGSAIGVAAAKAGMAVTYHDGAAAINSFFSRLAAGTASPRVIWIAGNEAWNDLDSAEITAVNSNATRIASFVNSGGGLMSHGTAYGWLSTLLPGLTTVDSGSSGDLSLTPAGQAAFPGLTNAHINAGPWHNHFEGNLGGLQVLTTSGDERDSAGKPAAVIIGGAAVVLPSRIVLTPTTATNAVGTSHTVTATVKNTSGGPSIGTSVTFKVVSGPNAGKTATAVTGASGQAIFTYSGSGAPGVDTIEGSFLDRGEILQKDTAAATWTAGAAASPGTRTAVGASSPACGQIVVDVTGLPAGLPHQIVVTTSTATGSPQYLVNASADQSQKASATIDVQKAFGTTGGTFYVSVRGASNQVTVSNTASVTVAACAAATPAPTPAPTPTPRPTPTPQQIGRLPSTSTGDGMPAMLLIVGLLALGVIAWRKTATRT